MHYLLENQNAFDLLENTPANSVDLLVSSPPYFMGKEYDSSNNIEDFIAVHQRLFPLLLRVLKPGGSLCWQVGNHVINGSLVPLDALIYSAFSSTEIVLRNRIVWSFGHGVHATKRFSGRHETVMWYTKGKDYYFDLDAVRIPQKYPGKKHYKGPKKGEYSGNPLGKNPGDVWEIPNVNANHTEKTLHPCQFPVGLIQRLVRALCPKQGLVMDPFAGVASSGVAAVLEGRLFLGSELDQTYFRIGLKRLQDSVDGTVRYRPVDASLYIPSGRDSVSKIPPHFKQRLAGEAV